MNFGTAELYDLLSGMYAYDMGDVDSGLHDETLRSLVIDDLTNLSDYNFRIIMSRFVREYFLSESALVEGYGVGDAASFIDWLGTHMQIEV